MDVLAHGVGFKCCSVSSTAAHFMDYVLLRVSHKHELDGQGGTFPADANRPTDKYTPRPLHIPLYVCAQPLREIRLSASASAALRSLAIPCNYAFHCTRPTISLIIRS